MFEENPLSPSTKTALWIGGVAAAIGAVIAFWPKAASANPAPATTVPVVGHNFAATTQLAPGNFYEIAMTIPTVTDANGNVSMVDRATLATAIASMGFSNGQILYYPGDPIANWPASIAKFGDPMKTVVFDGQYSGTATPVNGQTTIAMQMTS